MFLIVLYGFVFVGYCFSSVVGYKSNSSVKCIRGLLHTTMRFILHDMFDFLLKSKAVACCQIEINGYCRLRVKDV